MNEKNASINQNMYCTFGRRTIAIEIVFSLGWCLLCE